MYNDEGWTEYMAAIFRYLHEVGVKRDEILDCMTEIPLTKGMAKLFDLLSSEKFDVVIISDSNSVFISHIMKSYNYGHVVDKIFTNPAQFENSGCLSIKPFHDQDWCDLSTRNLCKGHILEEYIAGQKTKGLEYQVVAYVGDGSNDLCPALKLSKQDFVFPRIGFRLIKLLQKESDQQVHAQIKPWSSGEEIHDILNAL